MDKIHFPYRSDGHLRLLHVIAESGAWEKHGLQVEYDYYISSEDSHKLVASGEVEFVGGNHLTPYSARTRGDKWVYLGQTVSHINLSLILKAGSPVSGLSELKGKTLGQKGGTHPALNIWLHLKQHGLDADRGGVKLEVIREEKDLWQAVKDGKIDGAVVPPPGDLRARRAGLKTVKLDPLPMIEFTTFSSSLPFVEKHPDIVERFIKGTVEGIAFFKTHRKEAMQIIKSKYQTEGDTDDETINYLYDELNDRLMRKSYANIQAIMNAHEESVKQDKAAAKVNPMELWDFHFLRKIDDTGFIDKLYAN